MKEYNPLVIHKDSPFKESVEQQIKTTTDSDRGIILNEEVVITRTRQYMNIPWVKLTQDTELLRDLSPWACKVLVHISLNLTWNQERIKISCAEVGMDRRMFKRTMLELLTKRIVANTGVREWYWINVGLMVMGSITKHE